MTTAFSNVKVMGDFDRHWWIVVVKVLTGVVSEDKRRKGVERK